MRQFHALKFSLHAAEQELSTFEAWFATKTFVGEREIVGEISSRHHMCGLLCATAGIPAPDLIKFELTLSGLFRADLALGNDQARQFVLIEFEGAEEHSLFSRHEKTRQYRSFAHPLEHGFGQVVDWAWLKSDDPNAIALTNAFGGAISHSVYLLICGRDQGIEDDLERRRFEFRRHGTTVSGVAVTTLTYDDMVKSMRRNLETARSFTQT